MLIGYLGKTPELMTFPLKEDQSEGQINGFYRFGLGVQGGKDHVNWINVKFPTRYPLSEFYTKG